MGTVTSSSPMWPHTMNPERHQLSCRRDAWTRFRHARGERRKSIGTIQCGISRLGLGLGISAWGIAGITRLDGRPRMRTAISRGPPSRQFIVDRQTVTIPSRFD